MEYVVAISSIIGGFIILILGGEFLVKSAVSIASRFRISPMIVGLTIIAAGTSAPEIITSFLAAIKNSPDIALGNAIGSNIFNILGIVGMAAVFGPLIIDKKIMRFDYPLLIVFSLLLLWIQWDRSIQQWEAGFFLILLLLFIHSTIVRARNERMDAATYSGDDLEKLKSIKHDLIYLVGGLGALLAGAHIALNGGITLGQLAGLSERIIGITIISIGTGLPELATSTVASFRGRNDIAFSNIIGSNIINTLGIIGTAGAVKWIPVSPQMAYIDTPILIAGTLIILPLVILGKNTIGRLSGLLLILFYVSYLIYLVSQG